MYVTVYRRGLTWLLAFIRLHTADVPGLFRHEDLSQAYQTALKLSGHLRRQGINMQAYGKVRTPCTQQ